MTSLVDYPRPTGANLVSQIMHLKEIGVAKSKVQTSPDCVLFAKAAIKIKICANGRLAISFYPCLITLIADLLKAISNYNQLGGSGN